MRSQISLRSYIIRYAVASLLLGLAVVTTAFLVDDWIEHQHSLELESATLLASADKQKEQILPGILVSELYGSVELQLNSFLRQEGLDSILFVPAKSVTSDTFSKCLPKVNSFICTDGWSNHLKVAIPLSVTGRLLGYLVKAKTLDEKAAGFNYSAMTFAILGNVIVFLGILLSLLRFVDIHIRKPIVSLKSGIVPISADLNGQIETSFSVEELDSLATQVQSLVIKLNEKKISNAKANLAIQIAHDIRSPLMLLQTLIKQAHGLHEQEHQLLSLVAERINKIANTLEKNHSTNGKRAISPECFIASTIETIVNEKRAFYSKANILLKISDDAADFVVAIDPTDFGRAVSNLIDNGIEASSAVSEISIYVRKQQNYVAVWITDKGHGIRKDQIQKLGFKGNTFGKTNGQGLGLFQAKQLAESVSGSLSIQSEVGTGTTVELLFPIHHISKPCTHAQPVDRDLNENLLAIK